MRIELYACPFLTTSGKLERRLKSLTSEISSKVGVFCLSSCGKSLPMWAYYADGGRGVVVEFQDLDQVFRGDGTGVLNQVVPVRYEEDLLGVTFEPTSHKSLFFEKFSDWKHEQEHRVILPLDECRRIEKKNKPPLFLYNIDPRHIRRLILGCRMAKNTVSEIVEHVRESNSDVLVVRSKVENGKVIAVDSVY